MTTAILDASLIELLKRVDTPTVCNAIETAQGKRGFQAFTRQTVLAANPGLPAVVGYARTAKISAAVPSIEAPQTIRERRMAYYRYMADGPKPYIAVIEDTDFPNCIGAFWGEINSTVHAGLGADGALTNGVMRDLGDLAPGFQVIAGSIGPSHAFVRVDEIDCQVNIFGLTVMPGDLVHADRHGAAIVPGDIVPSLAGAIARMQESERLILEPARQSGFDIDKFVRAWDAFEKSRV